MFHFDRFVLDARDRRLTQAGTTVELSSRYLDALILLASERGKLVSKSRFMDEVWRGVPVTDEALTQCIRSLRRALDDDTTRPKFIETVPKHGYRFIATVTEDGGATEAVATPAAQPGRILRGGLIGAAGGGLAGALGGPFYGLMGMQAGGSAMSALLVVVCVTTLLGAAGGGAVGLGMTAAARGRPQGWMIAGGALGGMLIGAVVNLVGLDAFNLLFGQAPRAITGAAEGLVLGAAVGLGGWVSVRTQGVLSRPARVGAAGLITAAAGCLIVSLGGRLLGGSLASLAESFPGSHIRLDQVGALFSESGFGPMSHMVTAGLEGFLFGSCLIAAMIWADQRKA